MTNLFTAKTNFTSGELSQNLLGRVDLKAYDNGALSLKNVFIEPTGGIYRRPGLKYISALSGTGRLIAFEKSPTENYLIVLQNQTAQIFLNNELVTTLSTPWRTSQLFQVRWCQGGDTLYLVHPNTIPRKLVLSDSTWTLKSFSFLKENGCILQPYHKFCDDDVTITTSDITGNITLTASSSVFRDAHVNQQFKIAEGYVKITAVIDETHATATVLKKLDADGEGGLETLVWGEPAFGLDHGYPATVAFYQSRLVFGGSLTLPNYLWFSQTGDLTNFELGDAYDSEAIGFNILSDQSNTICALYAGRHLQVFTTAAEWMVSGDPLTPTNIQLKRQTQVGSPGDRFVPPIGIDGATIFASASNHEIREFLFADIEQAYQATDLSLMAGHLINTPIDQAYDKQKRQAYVIMQNGHLATLTSFRAEDIQCWSEQITDGQFISVAVVGNASYFLVKRGNQFFLEQSDSAQHTDCSFYLTNNSPSTIFSGLSALEGKTVKIVADGITVPDTVVTNGSITLEHPAEAVEVGLAFTHQVIPLPPSAGASNGSSPISSARLVKGVFRVIDTTSLEIDTGTGLHQELTRPLDSFILDQVPNGQTLDITVRSLGWSRAPTAPLWRIEGNAPKPFKLVSVTTDIQIGG